MPQHDLDRRPPRIPLPEPAGRPARPARRPHGATVAAAAAAEAAAYRPEPRAVGLPAFDRHVARRFSGGLTPGLASGIRAAGGGRAWFERQLQPTTIADPVASRLAEWFPSIAQSPREIFDGEEPWEVMADLSRWTVCRRIHSRRQLHEVLVDIWSNLLHVPLMDDEAWFHRVAYDRVIRRHALGSFEQLLHAAITHPAMGLYLDNAVSTKDAPNENLGRELLELHTVGVGAGYTEDDVKAAARMLTGYRVDLWWPAFRSFYDPDVHHTGELRVLDFRHDNAHPDGRAATRALLRHLAHHPATARRLARRLCVKFVSDSPSEDLVDAVSRAYLDAGTAIPPTLRALVDHPEFADAVGRKVRTPAEDYVATVRALGIVLSRPVDDWSFAHAMYWQYRELGQAPYEWPAPNGFPEVDAAWTSAGRLLSSFETHRDLAAGWWPSRGGSQAAWRPDRHWLPTLPATLDQVLDHVGRLLLGQAPSTVVKQGTATVLRRSLSSQLTDADLEDYWTVPAILSSLLDSPTHLHR